MWTNISPTLSAANMDSMPMGPQDDGLQFPLPIVPCAGVIWQYNIRWDVGLAPGTNTAVDLVVLYTSQVVGPVTNTSAVLWGSTV